MKTIISITLFFIYFNTFSQTPTWQLWASGLPQGVFPKLSIAPNHDIFYGLTGVGNAALKGVIYKANTSTATGTFTAMPTIPFPASVTNNIQIIECNANNEPIVGIFRSNSADPFLFKFDNISNTWSAVPADFLPVLGAVSMARSPNGTLWVGAKWTWVFKSTDNGVTFKRIDETPIVKNAYPCFYPTWGGNPSDGAIYSINVDKNGRVYAGTEGAGVIFSDDEGITWHPADLFACDANNSALRNANSTMKPISYCGNLGAIGFTANNNVIFNGASMWSLNNWSQNLGFADMTAKTVTQAQGFLQYFIGSGLQITKIVTTTNGKVFLHSGSNASVAGTIGIYTSTDGINWTLFNTGITGANDGQTQGSLAVDSNKVFMATHDGKIFMYDASVCPQNLAVNNATLSPFQATDNITTSGIITISSPQNIQYTAGKSILIDNGSGSKYFLVNQGGVFEAKIGGCL